VDFLFVPNPTLYTEEKEDLRKPNDPSRRSSSRLTFEQARVKPN